MWCVWATMAVAGTMPSRAVFSYNGVLWFVADAEAFTPMQAFEKEQQLVADDVVIYRLSHQGEAARFVSTQAQNKPLVPTKKDDRLFLPVSVDPVQVKDPLTQELLVIFPQADVFVPRTMGTLEVTLPATRMGVVVVVKKDSVQFNQVADGVEIVFNRPFAVTQDVPFVPAFRKGALDFAPEKQKEPAWLVLETQKLRSLVDVLSMRQSSTLKLELARLYLSQGFVPEALSVLNTLRTDDALALKGLALWLNKDPDGMTLWQNPYLKTDVTVALWLKAIKSHFSEEAIQALRTHTTDTLLAQALLVALEQDPTNKTVIQTLSALPLNKYQAQHFDVLQGKTTLTQDLSAEQCWLRLRQLKDNVKRRAPADVIAEVEMLRLAYPAPDFVKQANALLLPLYRKTQDYVSALSLCPSNERQEILQEGISVLQKPFDRLTLWYAFDALEHTLPTDVGVRQKILDDYLLLDLPDEANRFQSRLPQ